MHSCSYAVCIISSYSINNPFHHNQGLVPVLSKIIARIFLEGLFGSLYTLLMREGGVVPRPNDRIRKQRKENEEQKFLLVISLCFLVFPNLFERMKQGPHTHTHSHWTASKWYLNQTARQCNWRNSTVKASFAKLSHLVCISRKNFNNRPWGPSW